MQNHRLAAHAADPLAFTSGDARIIGAPIQLPPLADAILNGNTTV